MSFSMLHIAGFLPFGSKATLARKITTFSSVIVAL